MHELAHGAGVIIFTLREWEVFLRIALSVIHPAQNAVGPQRLDAASSAQHTVNAHWSLTSP